MAVDYTQQTKLQKVMEQVQLLIARADHPTTPPAEAETARKRADRLMMQYKIESLTAPQQTDLNAPAWATIICGQQSSEWLNFYASIGEYAARFAGCRTVGEWKWIKEEDGVERQFYVVNLVGFEGDVRYVEMLASSALMAFGSLLEPKFNQEETHAENALRLRKGGMERRRIAEVLFGSSSSINEQKAFNRRVTTMITQEAKRQGTPELVEELLGRGNSIKTYRESYASGFYNTLVQRLKKVADERAAFSDGTLVIANYRDRIDEAFYERYPNRRPKTTVGDSRTLGSPRENCPKCRQAKSGYCREHSYLKPSYAKTQKAFSSAGAAAGRRAASAVDLGGPARRLGS